MVYKIYTLGCKLNYAESSTIARRLEIAGFTQAARGAAAGVVIINSCSVTAQADHKARELIRRAVRENPAARVAVTGCYAKLKAGEIAEINGVSVVEADKSKLLALIIGETGVSEKGTSENGTSEKGRSENGTKQSFFASYSTGERVRSFLKIQDGCNYHCTYCTVWKARGESRNAPAADIVNSAREIAAAGVKEIVLTGVNIGDFGKSTGETFLDLLTALDCIEGIERYRISSIEPNLLTEPIIAFCAASSKFMPHFHIPLQSGSDNILKRMGRRYTSADFAAKIAAIRTLIPDVFIGVDVIVGFPGESDADFEATYNLLANLEPSYLHIFPYSPRANTTAAGMEGQIAPSVKKARAARLEQLNKDLQAQFYKRERGKPHKILVEGRDKKSGRLFGHSANFLRLEFHGHDSLIGTIV